MNRIITPDALLGSRENWWGTLERKFFFRGFLLNSPVGYLGGRGFYPNGDRLSLIGARLNYKGRIGC